MPGYPDVSRNTVTDIFGRSRKSDEAPFALCEIIE